MSEKCMIRAVVFDMDGVIFDSEKLVLRAWCMTGEKHHIPDVEETARACLGTNARESRNIFLRAYGEDFPYDDYKAEMRELFFGKCYGEHLPLKPGITELLAWLREQDIPRAVASSTSERHVRRELGDAGILDCFDIVLGGDKVEHSKPDPEIFLTACRLLGFPPEQCVGIEDSYNGVRSASSGGLYTVMVPDLLPPTDEMRRIAKAVLPDLFAAKELLEKEIR